MRLATYNLESLFERPVAMNLKTWADGKAALDDYARLNELIENATYSAAIKAEILQIMGRYKGLLTTGDNKFITLCESKGKFLYKPKNKPVEIAAAGRGDWIGWFALTTEQVDETATENTARIIGLVHADVQCVIEAEDRRGLCDFNDQIFPRVGAAQFRHAMLIDSYDPRGIDVGILTRPDYEITRMLSHVDDQDDAGRIFSRDCAEYEITTPSGAKVLFLVNHFKSKGYGSKTAAKRLRQANQVRKIYEERIKDYQYIAILGDFNATPKDSEMAPLLADKVLTDIMSHPQYQGDGLPGTWGTGAQSGKFDYILLSPELSKKVTLGGIERRGVWPGKHPHLDTLKKEIDAASDHAALWADVAI